MKHLSVRYVYVYVHPLNGPVAPGVCWLEHLQPLYTILRCSFSVPLNPQGERNFHVLYELVAGSAGNDLSDILKVINYVADLVGQFS